MECWESSHVFGRFGRFSGVQKLTIATRNSPDALSMSTMKGEPIFLWAEKGVNGLRIASQAWIVFFSSIVKSIGVVSGTVEPCLYVGRMVGKDQAPIVIMAYVDDLLVGTTSESALKTLMTALSAHVKVRETGRVGLKGGRSIFRRPGSSALYMQVLGGRILDEEAAVKSAVISYIRIYHLVRVRLFAFKYCRNFCESVRVFH